ncbi:MAG: hypothetical protein KC656_20915 [Myxococcales bacterium]|nr:hypothetical protein [Myxococcales bacterium]MCB9671914.1 hypothetical protein [Alphaproteobacteria bacterium]MCB9694020.1 hypothetical protein [Alphaproteobacteria bacterium]
MSSSEQTERSSRLTFTVLSVVLGWTWLYNLVIKGEHPVTAFFHLIDTLSEDLVMGSVITVVVGTGILVVFTLTKLYTQIISRAESFRMLEQMVAELWVTRDVVGFVHRLLRFEDQPVPPRAWPVTVGGALTSLALVYGMSWIYLVLFSEALFFVSWSAGVDLPITDANLELLPTLALAIPFSARVMAYLRYPYTQDYADFMPGAVFVLLLVASLGYLFQSDDQKFFLVQVLGSPTFLDVFLRGGLMLAFIPVFSEGVFWVVSAMLERPVEEPPA